MNLKGLILEALEDVERQKFIDSVINHVVTLPPFRAKNSFRNYLKDKYPNESFTPEELSEITRKRKNAVELAGYHRRIKDPELRERRRIQSKESKQRILADPIKRDKVNAQYRARFRRIMADPIRRDKLNATRKIRFKTRYDNDPEFALNVICRSRFFSFIKSKGAISFSKYVNIDYKDLIKHIESLFKPGMSWRNRCKWHIDHIRPLASFKFINDDGSVNQEELAKAWDISNLQPLWDKENITKGSKWDAEGKEHFHLEPKDLPKDTL
jgi:hypothetical protein